MTSPLAWSHAVTEIGEKGLKRRESASDTARRELAADLDLVSCDELTLDYAITALTGGRYRLTGRLEAGLVQACVVTLEPIPARINERFDIELRPATEFEHEGSETGDENEGEGDRSILSEPDVEPIEDGRIEVGRIAYEILAATLNPYPRKDGVSFDWTDEDAQRREAATHPFAALSKLRKSDGTP